ncbi:MAG: hypothetical protein LKJ90_07075 [Faecalibacterium sp.]|jgi:hypothetical protein|nr:hypothetical protein [Faecalibacterium sp.]
MIWPKLVPDSVCNVACTVTLTGPPGEDGAPTVLQTLDAKCNYTDAPKQIVDATKRLIQLSGTALFNGDIAPGVKILAGIITTDSGTWTIYRGVRARNPDGTVNFTKLELM